MSTVNLAPRFSLEDSIVMLVDHQTQTIGWVKSLPQSTVIAACRVLGRMAVTYDMPLIFTTTMEEYVGPTLDDISKVSPDAFEKRYKRGGQLSCWDDVALANGVAALGKKNIILAGSYHRYLPVLGGLRRRRAWATPSRLLPTPAARCPSSATRSPLRRSGRWE